MAPVKTDTCEVEPEKPISKRGKVIESEEEDYAPVEKSKSKSKEKSRPTAETAGRSRNGKGKAVETILWSDAESELAVVQGKLFRSVLRRKRSPTHAALFTDESERGEAATKKSKSRKSTKKSKMTPKGKPQKVVVASEFKSAEMIESDDEEGQEGIDRMAVKARPSHKSVTTKKLVPGKNAVSRVVETDEEEGEEEEEEEDEEQESIVASKHASSITPINRNLEAKGLKASKKAVTVSPTHSPAHKTISTPPLRSIPVNASSPAVKPQQPSVIIDKNGNVKAFKTGEQLKSAHEPVRSRLTTPTQPETTFLKWWPNLAESKRPASRVVRTFRPSTARSRLPPRSCHRFLRKLRSERRVTTVTRIATG